MSADLTLPGTLPGLLRRGAPTRERDGRTGVALRMETVSSFGVFAGEPAARVTLDSEPDRPPGQILCGFLHLDLTDPTGMDIAARWLAERVGLAVGATAPGWFCEEHATGEWDENQDDILVRVWCLRVPKRDEDVDPRASFASRHRAPWFVRPVAIVPGISTLTDPRAALRLACLHVGGGE